MAPHKIEMSYGRLLSPTPPTPPRHTSVTVSLTPPPPQTWTWRRIWTLPWRNAVPTRVDLAHTFFSFIIVQVQLYCRRFSFEVPKLSLPSFGSMAGLAVKNSLPFSYLNELRVLFISLFPWTVFNSFDFRLSCGNFRSVNSRVLLFHPLNKPSIANYIWVCFCLKELWFLKPKLIFAVRLENGPAGLSSPFVVSLFDGSNFFSWAQWRHFKLQ